MTLPTEPPHADEITLKRIELLHPKLREEARLIYEQSRHVLTSGKRLRFTHTLRTIAEQNGLYAQGRTKPGRIVTNARGGSSYHNYALAVDVCLIDSKGASWDFSTDFDGDGVADLIEVVKLFKDAGWEWGGDWRFKDMPHFQKTFGYSIKQLQQLYAEQGKPQYLTL